MNNLVHCSNMVPAISSSKFCGFKFVLLLAVFGMVLGPRVSFAEGNAAEPDIFTTPRTDTIPSSDSAEFRYAPIHLKVAEVGLTDKLLDAKRELIERSQVFEDAIHMSGLIYQDPELQKELDSLIPVSQLGDKADGFYYRIYVMKDPSINAMTTPTGSIYINSGLLAAIDNFDQLRVVLAHEVHHLLDQDIVHQFAKIRDEVGTIKFLQLIAAPAVAVAIGQSDAGTAKMIANIYTGANLAINISYRLSVFGYGRINESECDMYALNLFKQNNYDLNSARGLFDVFENEWKRYGRGFRSHLFMTHNTGKQRAEQVQKFMDEHGHTGDVRVDLNDERYHRLTGAVRKENALLNIKIHRVQHALDDLNQLKGLYPDDQEVTYLLGEAYAKLSQDPKLLKEELSDKEWKNLKIKDTDKQKDVWLGQAMDFYKQSILQDPRFANPYKGLALLHESAEEYTDAVANFDKYLSLSPEAKDRVYVRAKLKRSQGKLAKLETEETKKS